VRIAIQRSFFLFMGVKEMESVTVKEAGRKGGLTVLSKRGTKHFAEIGKKGQEIMKKRYPGMASTWGKKGGRPRKDSI
jgi:hypothetical protein